jgi:hypothetical protein
MSERVPPRSTIQSPPQQASQAGLGGAEGPTEVRGGAERGGTNAFFRAMRTRPPETADAASTGKE